MNEAGIMQANEEMEHFAMRSWNFLSDPFKRANGNYEIDAFLNEGLLPMLKICIFNNVQ